MKKLFHHAAFVIGFFIPPLLFTHAAAPISVPSILSLVPPAEALVISDLDVRDKLNRPVRSSTAHKHFEDLWSRNLTQLFLLSLTPAKLQMYILLQKNWGHAKHFLTQKYLNAQQKILALVPTGFSFANFFLLLTHLLFVTLLFRHVALSPNFVNDYLALIISSTRILR